MITALDQKMTTIMTSLKACQSRCYVDNPPPSASRTGRWRGLGRALITMIKF
jgi:hypothetical protein